MNSFTEHIAAFDPISKPDSGKLVYLEPVEMDYTFPNGVFQQLIEQIKGRYSIITFNNSRYRTFRTLYFDTTKNKLYIASHNGKRNRKMVRYKHCVESDVTFLEVKFINRKGRIKKKSLKVDGIKSAFSKDEIAFLKKVMPKKRILKLEPRLAYHYKRIVLANKKGNEQLTIDSDIKFIYNDTEVKSPEFSFAQIKVDRYSENSSFIKGLRDLGIRKGQIGKYVLGMSIFGNQKANLFNGITHRINKIIESYD